MLSRSRTHHTEPIPMQACITLNRDTSSIMVSMITELRFKGRGGLELCGSLHRPRNRSVASVIVCHGMLSSRASEKHVAICSLAAEHGMAAMRFDFAGRGQSAGDDDDLTVSGEVADLQAAVEFMRDSGFARPAVVGSSLGGTVAILCAAADRDLACLVTVAAPALLPERPRKAWGAEAAVSAAFFEDARRHDVLSAAANIRCPWLVIHGKEDEVVPVEHAEILCRESSSARLVVRSGADHRFSGSGNRRWLVETVVGALI